MMSDYARAELIRATARAMWEAREANLPAGIRREWADLGPASDAAGVRANMLREAEHVLRVIEPIIRAGNRWKPT